MSSLNRVAALARLDLQEVLRSRWLIFCGTLYAFLAGMFVLVGLRESSVLGFTGMGRVLLSLCHALVLLLPLLALTASGQVINRAREDGMLELFMSHPVTRGEYFAAVSLVRYLSLLLPLAALMVLLSLFGRVVMGSSVPWAFLGRATAVSACLLWAFVGAGLAVSVLVRNQAKAMMYLLLIWVLGVALLDFGLIGLMLQWRLNAPAVFMLAALNPVESARVALLSGADRSLGSLGPVGFYLANRLGQGPLFAMGLAWPAAAGTLAWFYARLRFKRGDLV